MIGNMAPQKIIESCWEYVVNISKALLIQYEFLTVEQINSTTKRDNLGRVRMTNSEKIKEGKYYIKAIHTLPKKVGYICSMPEIVHILKKRNQLLSTPPKHFYQFGQKDAQASINSLKKSYPELMSLFSEKVYPKSFSN